MCGRYQFSETDLVEMAEMFEQLNIKFGYKTETTEAKTGEIFPTDKVPVVILEDNRVQMPVYKWGFPQWNGKGVIINARAETAFEKKMFQKPLMSRRCVVPSTGFYEWQKRDPSLPKEKFLLRQPDSNILLMAGIANTFQDSGKEYDAFVILTTEANASVATIHDRMPVILSPEELTRWLNDPAFTDSVLRRTGPELVLKSA